MLQNTMISFPAMMFFTCRYINATNVLRNYTDNCLNVDDQCVCFGSPIGTVTAGVDRKCVIDIRKPVHDVKTTLLQRF